jgi:hypothetical protein
MAAGHRRARCFQPSKAGSTSAASSGTFRRHGSRSGIRARRTRLRAISQLDTAEARKALGNLIRITPMDWPGWGFFESVMPPARWRELVRTFHHRQVAGRVWTDPPAKVWIAPRPAPPEGEDMAFIPTVLPRGHALPKRPDAAAEWELDDSGPTKAGQASPNNSGLPPMEPLAAKQRTVPADRAPLEIDEPATGQAEPPVPDKSRKPSTSASAIAARGGADAAAAAARATARTDAPLAFASSGGAGSAGLSDLPGGCGALLHLRRRDREAHSRQRRRGFESPPGGGGHRPR